MRPALTLDLQLVPHPMSVVCPTCRAAVAARCMSVRGGRGYVRYHAARVRAAQDGAL